MRRRQKNMTVITATVILIPAVRPGCPAYGQGDITEGSDVVFDQLKRKKDVGTELVGIIEVTLTSTVVPSDVDFAVDPLAEFDAITRPGGRIISPGSLSVINHSVVSVKLEIASVALVLGTGLFLSDKFPGGSVQDFALVGTIAETGTLGRITLVLDKRNQTYINSWELERYAICPGRTGMPVAEIEVEERADLQTYGKVTADFYGAHQLTVKPIPKISAMRAQWCAAGLYKK